MMHTGATELAIANETAALFRLGWRALLSVLGATFTLPVLADSPLTRVGDVAPPTTGEDFGETAKGHGLVSVGYLNTYANGYYLDSNTLVNYGKTRSQGIALDLDYYFADAWSVHVGLPYTSNRYDGPMPHCPTTAPPQCAHQPVLNPPHPESQFLDDGNYHGTWTDWNLGIAYHANIGQYLITPSITASIPSHGYTFFAASEPAQHLWQVEAAATLDHQFDFSNWYYRLGYGYVFTESMLGTNVNHNKFDLELGYFVNEKLALRAFSEGKVGEGYSSRELMHLTAGRTNAYYYHHDQIVEANYFSAGVGFDWALGNKFTSSTSVQRLFWGESVFDFKYAFETRLVKEF